MHGLICKKSILIASSIVTFFILVGGGGMLINSFNKQKTLLMEVFPMKIIFVLVQWIEYSETQLTFFDGFY